jgi:hypothetical protein
VKKRASVAIRDVMFPHVAHMSAIEPDHMLFDRSGEPHRITVFTDRSFEDVYTDTSAVKIAWLVEPPDLQSKAYYALEDVEFRQRFDFVLTYFEDYLRMGKEFVFMPFGGCWIKPEQWRLHPKTKNLSIIASTKTWVDGHRLRHAAVETYGSYIDGLYGSAYTPIEDKITGLADFRYSLVIENIRRNFFFTEKLIDAFVTGTVPVFWGCPGISKFFNPDGIISFTSLEELGDILPRLGPEDYERRLPALQDNFERAKRYVAPEDYMYRYILEPRYGI